MSSYLTIYLRPKQEGEAAEKKEPMAVMAYSRSSSIYSTMNEELSIAYAGNNVSSFTEITRSDICSVIRYLDSEIETAESHIESLRKSLKDATSTSATSEILDRIDTLEEYVLAERSTLNDIRVIQGLVEAVDDNKYWADFDAVLANVD